MCAVIKRGILGGFQNKIGNIVGTSWKGIAVMKSLPLSVANPKTAAQINQRTIFAQASRMGSDLLANVVKPLNDRFAQHQSGFNVFVNKNFGKFDAESGLLVSPLTISTGKLDLPTAISMVAHASTDVLNITWTNNGGSGYALDTDEAYVVCVNGENDKTFVSAGLVTRVTGVLNLSIPGTTIGDAMKVSLAFRRADGSIVSNTEGQSMGAIA